MADEKRLISFVYNNDTAYIIELGDYYMRFFRNGAIVESGGSPYQIGTIFPEASVFDIKFMQVVDTMYLVHPDYYPQLLTRVSNASWNIADVAFYRGPFLDENTTDTTVGASAATGTVTLTASTGIWTADNVGSMIRIKGDVAETVDVSAESAAFTDPLLLDKNEEIVFAVAGSWTGTSTLQKSYDGGSTYLDYFQTTNNDTLSITSDEDDVFWRAGVKSGDYIDGTVNVRITHKDKYGYADITVYTNPTTVTAVVSETLPDIAGTTKWAEGAFSERRGYPAAVGFSKQRSIFANTYNKPTTYHGSQIDDYTNFDIGTADDDDSFAFTIASNEVNGIQSFIDQKVLLAFTERNIWRLSDIGKTITPSAPSVEKQTGFGANFVQPIQVGNTVLYAETGGQRLRSLSYEFQFDSWISEDVSVRSEHLLRNGTIVDMAFAPRPDNILYMVMSTGDMVTCLYDPSNKLIAFSELTTTSGNFKSVATIPGANRDEVWAIVEREIDSTDVWYVEQFTNPYWEEQDEYIFMDCSLTYTGEATTTISGLSHLEGQSVDVLIGGAVYPYDTTVASGIITLEDEWIGTGTVTYHVGLSYTTTMQSMRLNPPTALGSSLGKMQSQYDISMVFQDTINAKLGKDEDNLFQMKNFSPSVMGQAPTPFSGIETRPFPYGHKDEAYVTIVSDKPLPFSLLGFSTTMDVSPR